MKYRTILVILALSTFTLFGCGKTETNIPEISIEEEITDTTTDADESNKEADAEVLETDATESEESMLSSDTSPLDPSNITLNSDGTYGFTDEFLVAVQTINGAAALDDTRLDVALQNAAEAILGIGLTNEQDIISTIESEIAIQEYHQMKDQANQGSQQQTQNQGNNSNSSGQDQVTPGPVEEQVIGGPGFSDGTGDMTLGEGDGTHVGTGH